MSIIELTGKIETIQLTGGISSIQLTGEASIPDIASLVSAVVPTDGLTVILTYDENLDESSVPSAGDFSLSGTSSVVASVAVDNKTVTLTVDTAILIDEEVTVDYTKGTNPIRSITKIDVSSLSSQGVTNNGTEPVPVTEITDYDGNVYTSVIIGTQEWLVENLKTTHFNNGDEIPNLTDDVDWSDAGLNSSPALCAMLNDQDSVSSKGYLYNWFVIQDALSKGIAPEGYKIPTIADWNTFYSYVVSIGRYLPSSNFQVSDGWRLDDGFFLDGGGDAVFWGASGAEAMICALSGDNVQAVGLSDFPEGEGVNIKCIRDI